MIDDKIRYSDITNLPDYSDFLINAGDYFEDALDNGKTPAMAAFTLRGIRPFIARYGIDEGNRFLYEFEDLLIRRFGEGRCTKNGEYSYLAFMMGDGVDEAMPAFLNDVGELDNGNRVRVKIGVFNRFSKGDDIESACDRAKMACDHKKHSGRFSSILYFDDRMEEELLNRNFVLNNIDDAIRDGNIKVYYQMRTRLLNNKFSGAEALARWEDPMRGSVSPAVFIPVLEENNLTWKLDTFVIHKIAEDLRYCIDNGINPVPVSFNLTYTDFLLVDFPETVKSIITDHGIDTSLLIIEITEETVLRNTTLIKEEIEKFHSMGFKVMIDDFGNGYSSINMLSDFRFDAVKIDVEFMRNFNDRNKKIVESIVVMAKNLGIITVSEGVETKEQLTFLKNIGCQASQGYYLGKPRPLFFLIKEIKEQDIGMEDLDERELFDKAGLVNFITDKAMLIMRYYREKLELFHANDEVLKILSRTGYSIEDAFDRIANDEESERGMLFRKTARKMYQSGRNAEISFSAQDRSFRLENKVLASNEKGLIICSYIYESAVEDAPAENVNDDSILKDLIPSYNNIYFVNLDENTVKVMKAEYGLELAGNEYNYDTLLGGYLKKGIVFSADIDRFTKTFESRALAERMKVAGDKSFIDIFRIKLNEVFKWASFRVNAVRGSDGKKLIVCFTAIERSAQVDFMEMANRVMGVEGGFERMGDGNGDAEGYSSVFMWNSLMELSDVKYFWKDKERRFLGASKSFLDFYGMEIGDILGKNDEEMGWHTDDMPYRTDELNVLEKGVIIRNSPGQIYAKGEKVNILATKYPLYRNGEVVGLLGYFYDTDTVLSDEAEMDHALFIDNLSGLLNPRGLLFIMQGLDDNYRQSGMTYAAAAFEVAEYPKIYFKHGKEAAEAFSIQVGRCVAEAFGNDAVIAKTGSCCFTVCIKGKTVDEVNSLNEKCIEDIKNSVSHPDENKDLTVSCGTAYCDERPSVQEMLNLLLKRLNESRKYNGIDIENAGNEVMEEPDIHRDLPLPMMILRPVYSDKGVKDVRYVFVNDKYCEYTGSSRSDLIGRGYCECFGFNDDTWFAYVGRAANGETVSGRAYISALGHWMEFIGIPSSIPGCCSTMFWPVEDSKNERDFLTKGHAADNAIIRIAGYLNDTDEYDKAVHESLRELGRVTGSDRVYILDAEGIPLFEWSMSGVISRTEIGESAPEIVMDRLRAEFMEEGCCIVEDVEKVKKKNPKAYDFIKKSDINCYIFVPLYDNDGKIMGILGSDNYDKDSGFNVKRLLKEVSYFLSSKMIAYRLMKRLNIMSNRDELTGLLNRHGFRSEMDRYLMAHPDDPFTMVLIDVDDFKIINDMYGHAAGDEVLVNLADDLNAIFEDRAIIARSGGDEISVAVKKCTAEEAEPMIKELSKMEHTFSVDDNSYNFRLSIGYSEYPAQADDLSLLLKQADAALYSVKSQGKHGFKQYAKNIKTTKRLQLAFNLKNVARNLPGAILVYTADDDKKILYANEELISMFECSDLDEFIEYTGGTFDGIVYKDDIERVDEAIWDQINNNKYNGKDYVDYRIITKKGVIREVIDVGRYEENEFYGKVFYVILIDRDERKSSKSDRYDR